MEFKEVIKDARKKLDVLTAQTMPCKRQTASTGQHVARKMITSQHFRSFWKQMKPRDCVWKELYIKLMKTILHEKKVIHCIITTWYTNSFLCLKEWKYLQPKQQRTKNGKIEENFRHGIWRQSEINLKQTMMQEIKV